MPTGLDNRQNEKQQGKGGRLHDRAAGDQIDRHGVNRQNGKHQRHSERR
jgi:hypothetical protein